jgi:hypothetical protein
VHGHPTARPWPLIIFPLRPLLLPALPCLQGLKAALDAAVSIKGLLEMMHEVVSDWIEDFIQDIEGGQDPALSVQAGAAAGGGSCTATAAGPGGQHPPGATPRSSAPPSRRVSSAGECEAAAAGAAVVHINLCCASVGALTCPPLPQQSTLPPLCSLAPCTPAAATPYTSRRSQAAPLPPPRCCSPPAPLPVPRRCVSAKSITRRSATTAWGSGWAIGRLGSERRVRGWGLFGWLVWPVWLGCQVDT